MKAITLFPGIKLRLLILRVSAAILACLFVSSCMSFSYGQRYYAKKEYKEAVNAFNKGISLNPQKSQLYLDRGGAYRELGQYQAAINDFTKAISLEPAPAPGATVDIDSPSVIFINQAYWFRADTFNKAGRYQEAIDDCNRLIEINPNSAVAYHCRGSAYLGLGQYQKAIDDCNRAADMGIQDSEEEHHVLAVAYTKLRQYQDAIIECDDDLKKFKQDAKAYSLRAEAYEKLGKKDYALRDRKRASELSHRASN